MIDVEHVRKHIGRERARRTEAIDHAMLPLQPPGVAVCDRVALRVQVFPWTGKSAELLLDAASRIAVSRVGQASLGTGLVNARP